MTQPEKPEQASSHENSPCRCSYCVWLRKKEQRISPWEAYPATLRDALETLHVELTSLGVEGDVRVLLPNPGHLGLSRLVKLQQYGPCGRIELELEESAKEPYVPSLTRGDL